MAKNTTNSAQIKPLRGLEVIEEAARLLRDIRFSPSRGAYAEGTHVAVSVDPRWNEDHQTICALLTCYAFRHRRVDWEGLRVTVRSEIPGGGGGEEVLNARGQAVLTSLLPGDYRLSLDVGSVDRLLALTSDADATVREAAAQALGQIGAERAVDRLLALTSDTDIWVRRAAARALEQIGAERASGRPAQLSPVSAASDMTRRSRTLELPPLRSMPLAASSAQSQTAELRRSEALVSEDGSPLLGMLYRNRQGHIVLEFRSQAAPLKGWHVPFVAIRQETNEEKINASVPLEPDAQGVLTGSYVLGDALDYQQAYKIEFFEPVPPPEEA